MNGEDLANKAGIKKENRFIFSDSYYENMPEIPEKPNFDLLAPSNRKENTKTRSNQDISLNDENSNSIVQKASNFDQVIHNNYLEETSSQQENVFNFFSHQENTKIEDITPETTSQESKEDEKNPSSIENKNIEQQNNFFQKLGFQKEKQVKNDDKNSANISNSPLKDKQINFFNDNHTGNDFADNNTLKREEELEKFSDSLKENTNIPNEVINTDDYYSNIKTRNNDIFKEPTNSYLDIKKETNFSEFDSNEQKIEPSNRQEMENIDFINRLKNQEELNKKESSLNLLPNNQETENKKNFFWETKKSSSEEQANISKEEIEFGHSLSQPSIEEGRLIINGDATIQVDESLNKNEVVPIPDFMSGNIQLSDLNIETGINRELEEELMRNRESEEERKRRENAEYNEYRELTEGKKSQKMVYKAGGKSYIREVVEKPKIEIPKKSPEPEVVSKSEVKVTEEKPKQEVEVKKKQPQSIEELIESIVEVPDLANIKVKLDPFENPGVKFGFQEQKEKVNPVKEEVKVVYDEKKDNFDYDQNFDNVEVKKSNLLNELIEKNQKEGKISVLARYGEDFCARDYITNPAIGRAEEIKQLILILLTPEKSGILIGKPGIGKTSIVEGLAYQLQRNNVPEALKGYRIVSVKTSSLLGSLPTGETRLQTLVDELKELDKIILFIDEIHMLVGATNESAMDFANMFKESLGRGSIKVIGATTTEEYERYILRDKAFVRRFQKVEVEEPNREHTIKILLGTLPKIEKTTGARLKYSEFMKNQIMSFIVDITTEYKRIYGIGSRYPDICLTLLSQAFSQAVFANRSEVNINDIRKAIENSKNIYPDVIRKELVNFDQKFKDLIREEELGK